MNVRWSLSFWCNSLVASLCLYVIGIYRSLRWDRCVVFFVADPEILTLVTRCIVLNGFIFLGSIVFFNLFMRPMVLHLLVASLPTPQAAVVASVLAWLDNVLWLLPAYALAFFISSTWYTEIGERTAMAAQRDIEQKLASRSGVVLPASTRPVQVSKPDWLTQLSRGLYWLLILSNFLIVVWLAPAVPYVGGALRFFLLSWIHALYCFDYKWGVHNLPLERRIAAFEEHSVYFAGFGSILAAVTCASSFFVGASLVGVFFPMFIMTAIDADPKESHAQVLRYFLSRGRDAGIITFPVLRIPVKISHWLLSGLSIVAKFWRKPRSARASQRRSHASCSVQPRHSS